MLGCWGWKEGDINCGYLENEIELVVLELWRKGSCVKRW